MKWLLTSVAATLMFCAPAAADGLTGRALAEGCQENSLERVACLAYMEGYAHGFGHPCRRRWRAQLGSTPL